MPNYCSLSRMPGYCTQLLNSLYPDRTCGALMQLGDNVTLKHDRQWRTSAWLIFPLHTLRVPCTYGVALALHMILAGLSFSAVRCSIVVDGWWHACSGVKSQAMHVRDNNRSTTIQWCGEMPRQRSPPRYGRYHHRRAQK